MVPWRFVFFVINFGAVVLFFTSCVVAVVVAQSPGSFLGGACFIWPVIAFGISEWGLFVRGVRGLERPLGVCCGLIGGLALFALVSTVAEEILNGTTNAGLLFWVGFSAACLAIAAYGFWCCWYRLRYGEPFREKPDDPTDYCKTCGYNLTGNISGVCPECGTPI